MLQALSEAALPPAVPLQERTLVCHWSAPDPQAHQQWAMQVTLVNSTHACAAFVMHPAGRGGGLQHHELPWVVASAWCAGDRPTKRQRTPDVVTPQTQPDRPTAGSEQADVQQLLTELGNTARQRDEVRWPVAGGWLFPCCRCRQRAGVVPSLQAREQLRLEQEQLRQARKQLRREQDKLRETKQSLRQMLEQLNAAEERMEAERKKAKSKGDQPPTTCTRLRLSLYRLACMLCVVAAAFHLPSLPEPSVADAALREGDKMDCKLKQQEAQLKQQEAQLYELKQQCAFCKEFAQRFAVWLGKVFGWPQRTAAAAVTLPAGWQDMVRSG